MKKFTLLLILSFLLLINKGYCYYRNYYDYDNSECYCSYNRCRCTTNRTRYIVRYNTRTLKGHHYARSKYNSHSHHLMRYYNYRPYYNFML